MEEATKLVSDAILGESIKYASIGGEVYGITPPSIKTILTAMRHLSKVQLEKEKYSQLEIMSEFHNLKHICRALAVFIKRKDGLSARWLARKLEKGTIEEVASAFAIAVGLMGANDFFALAQLAKSVRKTVAIAK